jgi:hypothetical protein
MFDLWDEANQLRGQVAVGVPPVGNITHVTHNEWVYRPHWAFGNSPIVRRTNKN